MIDRRVKRILGYDRILEMLAEKAQSSLGKKLAEELEPADTPELAERLTEETKEAETITLSQPSFPLQSFSDIGPELGRLRSGAGLNAKELMRISQVLKASRRAKKGIQKDELGRLRLLPAMAGNLFLEDEIVHRIDEAILGEDEISDFASPELRSIRRKIQSENAFIREKLNSMIRGREHSKYLQDAIITMRNGRYVIPVKQEYRGAVQGLVHDESQSGATLFIEPVSVVEANNRLHSLEGEERREIERILLELSDLARPYTAELQNNLDILAYLDLIFAKAALAVQMGAFPGAIHAEGVLDIREGRHPLIDKNTVIPVSLRLEPEKNTLIITGPNTGGKTVTLKLVGLFAAMNQSGLFLPAGAKTALPLFHAIYADIGDEQSIEQSLSTFSSHMKNITYILRHAQKGDLVLLDELGAGTDPEEGTALALAILEEMNRRGVKLLTTTHYSEIKAFALTAPGFVNASMEFDSQSLKPTYRLLMGVAGSSNAFLISKRLGLKREIIENAKSFMRDERLQFDSLLTEAERTRSKAQRELERAREMEKNAKEIDAKAKKLERDLEERRKAALEKAREEAYEIVRKAREETEDIIKEAKKLQKMSQPEATKTVEKVRRELSAKSDTMQKQMRESKKPHTPPKKDDIHPGDSVRICSLGADATVLEAPDGKGMVAVQAGIMKMTVHYTDLEKKQGKSGKKAARTSSVRLVHKPVPLSLNLHGYTVEEALLEIDKYLDDAFVAGLSEVSIIHGKGTGALRSGVQNYLRDHPHVAKFRLGKYGEGEAGVTVVTLK